MLCSHSVPDFYRYDLSFSADDRSTILDVLQDLLTALSKLLDLRCGHLNLLIDASAQVDLLQGDVQLAWAKVVKVATNELVLLAHSEQVELVRHEEEDRAETSGPHGDAQAANDLEAE